MCLLNIDAINWKIFYKSIRMAYKIGFKRKREFFSKADTSIRSVSLQ